MFLGILITSTAFQFYLLHMLLEQSIGLWLVLWDVLRVISHSAVCSTLCDSMDLAHGFLTPWTIASQSLCLGSFRLDYWVGCHFSSRRPNKGLNQRLQCFLPALGYSVVNTSLHLHRVFLEFEIPFIFPLFETISHKRKFK